MRILMTAVLVAMALGFVLFHGSASAATDIPSAAGAADVSQPRVSIDLKDASLVEVQLFVAGAAAFVVVGVGLAGYRLRKRLGKVPWPQEPAPGEHH